MLWNINVKRVMTALLTMCVAALAGFVMQNGFLGDSASIQARSHRVSSTGLSYTPLAPKTLSSTLDENQSRASVRIRPNMVAPKRKAPMNLAPLTDEATPVDFSPLS